jgi:hypothetical protein
MFASFPRHGLGKANLYGFETRLQLLRSYQKPQLQPHSTVIVPCEGGTVDGADRAASLIRAIHGRLGRRYCSTNGRRIGVWRKRSGKGFAVIREVGVEI